MPQYKCLVQNFPKIDAIKRPSFLICKLLINASTKSKYFRSGFHGDMHTDFKKLNNNRYKK